MSTFFESSPVMINPPIATLFPFIVNNRVEMLSNSVGFGAGVGVGVDVGFGVGVGVPRGVGVGLPFGVGLGVGVPLGVGVAVGVGVGVGGAMLTVRVKFCVASGAIPLAAVMVM